MSWVFLTTFFGRLKRRGQRHEGGIHSINYTSPHKFKNGLFKGHLNKQWMLFILTSKQVLCTPFAGQNQLLMLKLVGNNQVPINKEEKWRPNQPNTMDNKGMELTLSNEERCFPTPNRSSDDNNPNHNNHNSNYQPHNDSNHLELDHSQIQHQCNAL